MLVACMYPRLERRSRRASFLHHASIAPPCQTRTPRVHISHACPLPCTEIGCLELIFDRALFWLPASSKVVPKAGCHQPRDASVVSFWRCGTHGKAFATAPFCGLQSGTPCCALDADTAGRSYWPPKSRQPKHLEVTCLVASPSCGFALPVSSWWLYSVVRYYTRHKRARSLRTSPSKVCTSTTCIGKI